MRLIVIGLAVMLHGMAGCSDPQDDRATPTDASTASPTASPLKAMATLRGLTATAPDGGIVGWVNFTDLAGALTVDVQLVGATGLDATAHGLHVHANGDCGGDGTTPGSKAGGHFNPANATHGAHAGDLGNITTDAFGNGTRTILASELTSPLTLGPGTYGILGRSVVVHADPDDGRTDPAGNSGPRRLCGVISAA